jgi:hypothetical protein
VHHHKKRLSRHLDRPEKVPLFTRFRALQPLGMGVLCLVILAKSVIYLARGRMIYTNYRGLKVFVPFAIAIGVLGLWAVFATWKKYQARNSQGQKH